MYENLGIQVAREHYIEQIQAAELVTTSMRDESGAIPVKPQLKDILTVWKMNLQQTISFLSGKKGEVQLQ
ncbi:hypothetical protein QUF58_13990 [Anaerolineales bacterium HSG24]|nr:hypothetical protein [Anaerolineales bacterium HSG24]